MIRRPAPAGPSQADRTPALFWILQLAFIAVNVVIVVWMPKHGAAAMWHGRFTLLGGVILAMLFSRPAPAAYAAAYITGCEVFWRMKKAELPWEMGKYAVILVLGMAIIRSGKLKRSFLPAAYFILLLPSCILGLGVYKGDDMREQLTFNLLGPLALAVCALFFASVPLSVQELRNTLICLIGPVTGIAILGVQMLQEKNINFNADVSNAAASGGYGPNQVAAALGLGMLAVLVYLTLGVPSKLMLAAMLGVFMLMLRQCILSFSRGGLYMVVGAVIAGGFFLVRDQKQRKRLFMGGAVIAVILLAYVLPRVQEMTRGAVGERFSSIDTTGRSALIEADIETFFRNPVLGIGPGLGEKNRLKYFRVGTAHTEWTRMLAEHGTLGILSIIAIFALALANIRRAETPREKAIAAAFMMYAFLHMCVDATRLVAPSFAFGLGAWTVWRPRRRIAAAPAKIVRPRPPGVPARAAG